MHTHNPPTKSQAFWPHATASSAHTVSLLDPQPVQQSFTVVAALAAAVASMHQCLHAGQQQPYAVPTSAALLCLPVPSGQLAVVRGCTWLCAANWDLTCSAPAAAAKQHHHCWKAAQHKHRGSRARVRLAEATKQDHRVDVRLAQDMQQCTRSAQLRHSSCGEAVALYVFKQR